MRARLRNVPLPLLFLAVFAALPVMAQIEGTNWFPIGPSPIDGFFSGGVSGRATAIAVNPMNANDVWLGTAAGGVWHTRNAGVTWEPESDREDALAIGAIAVDECNADGCAVIYAGTGENAIRRDTIYGAGLLVGATTGGEFPQFGWTQRTGAPAADFRFASINDVVLDPTTSGGSKRIFITLSSGVTVGPPESTVTAPNPMGGHGIYRSNDRGATWTKLTVAGSNGARPTDLDMRPDNHDVLFAGFLGRGVFRSTDNGASWCPLNQGIAVPPGCPVQDLPNVSMPFDFVSVAIAPSNNNVVYATFGLCPDQLISNCRAAVWRSTDGGANWEQRQAGDPANGAAENGYSRYTHALTVDPANSDIVFRGGVSLWRSTNGGTSFSTSQTNTAGGTLHSDHRDVVFAPSDASRAYNTGDGGFAISTNSGVSWTPRNDLLQTIGFHGLSASPKTISVLGTAQDNSGELWDGGSRRWNSVPCCGDGGFSVLDWDDPMKMYAGSNFGDVRRSTDGGVSFPSGNSALWAADPRLFYAPIVQGPKPLGMPANHPLFFGTNRLFRSVDDAVNWEAISPVLATGNFPEIVTAVSWPAQTMNPTGGQNTITAIAQSASQSKRIYVGYYGGEVFRSKTTGMCPNTNNNCWELVDSGLPNHPVSGIAVHPTDHQTAYVTFSGFGSHARVWKTVNGGDTWSALTTGIPANIPANAVSLEPSFPSRVYVGLDSGPDGASLYRSTNGGTSFSAFAQGLPNAPVFRIEVDEFHGRIYAATHGRGAFVLSKPFISNFEGWVNDSIWDIPVYGHNFLANKPCTMRVLQSNGSVCATGTVDVMGGTIRTDATGQLETSKVGFWNGKKVAWACFNGNCLGNTPIAQCYDDADGDGDPDPLSSIHLNCDGQIATGTVLGCPPLDNPPSSFLNITGMGGGGGGGGGLAAAAGEGAVAAAEMPEGRERMEAGVLLLTASVQRRVGTASLCSVRVPYYSGETDEQVLERAQAAVNGSPTCAANRVRAVLDRGHAGPSEDEFARRPRLLLEAPGVVGGQLITAVHTDPGSNNGACIRINGIGVPVLQQIHVLKIELNTPAGGAGGGTLTLTEETPLGPCRITIPTLAGQTRQQLAAAVSAAIEAPGIPGPHPECPSERNARDITNHAGSLISVFATRLELCTTDPKIGFDVRSEELANVHPIAEAGDDRVLPNGPVQLTAMLSADPDSTPGTHDDIVAYEWFDVTTGPPVLLGSTEVLNVPLAEGLHRIRLRVTDEAGLSDVDETLVSIDSGAVTAGGRWLGSFHVGSAHPLADLSSPADTNIHVRADLGYALSSGLRLLLMGGLSQMTAETAAGVSHPRYVNASLNAQFLFPQSSGTAFFLEGGPGVYWPKGGGSDFGFNLGLGWQLPVRAPYRLELGADYHRVPGADAEFITVQFGVLFR